MYAGMQKVTRFQNDCTKAKRWLERKYRPILFLVLIGLVFGMAAVFGIEIGLKVIWG